VVTEVGGLSCDQGTVAAVGAGDADDMFVGLADRAVMSLGDAAAAVQVQPQAISSGGMVAEA
jgi:hypothetical protein